MMQFDISSDSKYTLKARLKEGMSRTSVPFLLIRHIEALYGEKLDKQVS